MQNMGQSNIANQTGVRPSIIYEYIIDDTQMLIIKFSLNSLCICTFVFAALWRKEENVL